MKPVLPLLILIPLLIFLLVVGGYVSWRSTRNAKTSLRRILVLLRGVTLVSLAAFLINPGTWIIKTEEKEKVYPILIDDSASMAVKVGEIARMDIAKDMVSLIQAEAMDSGKKTKLYSFSGDVREVASLDELSIDGDESDVHSE